MRAMKFAKRQAVSGRRFREKQHGAAREHSLGHGRIGAGDRAAPLAIHENSFLQARESGTDRPRPNLLLGDETHRLDAANRQYVKPRQMICNYETRPIRLLCAVGDNIQTD